MRLLDESVGWVRAREIAYRLRPFPAVRHRFYEHDSDHTSGGRPDRIINAWTLLLPEDWRWLRDQAIGRWAGRREVWDHAYWLARQARDDGRLAAGEWERFAALVEHQAPGLPVASEETRGRFERDRATDEAARRVREEQDPTRRPLAERVRAVLDDPRAAAEGRMRCLSELCFVSALGLRSQAVGEWADLPADLRDDVLAACRAGLDAATPTPIPEGNSYPCSILWEGEPFARLAVEPGGEWWLTEQAIRKWLPTALFARMSGEWAGLIRACRACAAAATEDVLLDTVADQARRSDHPSLWAVPSECWTDRLTGRLAELAEDASVRPAARRVLLERLAIHDPDRAAGIAADWADRSLLDGEPVLRPGGRNVLLVVDPAAALDRIEPDADARGPAVVEELPALWAERDEFRAGWADWPVELVERLGRLLLRHYPPDADPESRASIITPDQHARWLRDRLLSSLTTRDDPEAPAALDRLAAVDPHTAEWVATRRASATARAALPGFDPAAVADPDSLSPHEAVRLLDHGDFRLVRTADDLLDVILEALRQIAHDVGHDLPMLYGRPDGTPRKRLLEEALQAYLRRRLGDLMSRVADGVAIPPPTREDQIAFRRRLDLRVTAPCRGGGSVATVVIEIKWSDNPDTATSLTDQLGTQYLLGERLTHGVYLVGWTGEWSPGDWSRTGSSLDGLRQRLADQRDEFCRPGSPGYGLRIEPVVIDLRRDRS